MTSEKDNQRRSILAAEIDDKLMSSISAAKVETEAPYTLDDIADELDDLRAFVRYIASDRHELSHEKAMWQRDDWKRRALALVEKHWKARATPSAPRQVNDDF